MTLGILTAREAIASVSASHPEVCICVTCRAARGDEDALAEVLTAVADVELAEQAGEHGRGV